MSDRFDDLDHFLPPAPARTERATADQPAPTARRQRRVRSGWGRWRRRARFAGAVVTVAAMGISVAYAARSIPQLDRATPSVPARAGIDVSLGADSGNRVAHPPRSDGAAASGSRDREARRDPRRYRRTLSLQRSAPVGAGSVSQPPLREVEPNEAVGSRRSERAETRRPSPPPPPTPPQTPLFHCVTDPGNEHYVTIDRARAGQLSEPRSGWSCSVVGHVYQDDAPGRAEIELDDGSAYVLARRTRTEPASELTALYRHWAGYDWYYSESQADGGMVGFIAS